MQSKEQLQAELSELEAKAASIREQIKSLDKKPTPEHQKFIELMLQVNSWKIDQEKYSNCLFGFKDSKLLWIYISQKKELLLKYDLIWQILESDYSMTYLQIQNLTQNIIKDHFKLKRLNIGVINLTYVNEIEEHFNFKGLL